MTSLGARKRYERNAWVVMMGAAYSLGGLASSAFMSIARGWP